MKSCFSILLISCILFLNACKEPTEIKPSETSTVTDIDGNVYKTIKIGNQWWMAENLKVTKYRNGMQIPNVLDTLVWNKKTTGAFCIYNLSVYAPGKLYNWFVVNDTSNIAPVGWHVPSDEEWKELELHLGMSNLDVDQVNWRGKNQGNELKEKGTSNWKEYSGNPDVWANNESNFSALPGGCRMFNGIWSIPLDTKSSGFWWSSTENTENNQVWYRSLDYKKTNVFRFYGTKTYGFSIRCVKNE